jgi:hypothetical protein
MYDEIVEITTGTGLSAMSFKMHKGLLSHYSSYFDKALNGDFKEGKTGRLALPEEQGTIFKHFVLWVYSGKIEIETSGGIDFMRLCKLWVLAD